MTASTGSRTTTTNTMRTPRPRRPSDRDDGAPRWTGRVRGEARIRSAAEPTTVRPDTENGAARPLCAEHEAPERTFHAPTPGRAAGVKGRAAGRWSGRIEAKVF